MTQLLPLGPCLTSHLFRPLHSELLTLLRGLSPDDWRRQTVAPQWKVRDVAAHMLDVDLRRLAVNRDGHYPPIEKPPANDREIATLVNTLNAGGVQFAARLSPRLITDLLEVTGRWVADLMETLPPYATAVFPVSWAGEAESQTWMDVGREYTERWHHQMQVRAATARPAILLEPQWMEPLLNMSVRALPYAFRGVPREPGTSLTLIVDGATSGAWTLRRGDSEWEIAEGASENSQTVVRVAADVAWRMLYNAPFDREQVAVEGDATLAAPLLKTRSVIV